MAVIQYVIDQQISVGNLTQEGVDLPDIVLAQDAYHHEWGKLDGDLIIVMVTPKGMVFQDLGKKIMKMLAAVDHKTRSAIEWFDID